MMVAVKVVVVKSENRNVRNGKSQALATQSTGI